MTKGADMPEIVLITVTYNSEAILPGFLNSLFAQDRRDWKLIVVDNDSQDGTQAALGALEDSRIRVLYEPENIGVAAANNRALQLALSEGAERIVLINNDVEFDPTLLRRLDHTLEVTGADAVSPVIPYFSRPEAIWYAGGSFVRARGVRNRHDREGCPLEVVGETPFRTDYAPTTCLMIRSSVFERVGLLDERYFIYWEDTDLLWRMKMHRVEVIVEPGAILLHKVSVTSGGRLSDVSIRYVFRNQIFFTRKYHGAVWAVYTAFMAGLAGSARVALCGDSLRHLALRVRAIIEGFRMSLV